MAARETRGWRPDPLSDSDVLDLAESGATRWELTPAHDSANDPAHASAQGRPRVARGAGPISVWNLAAMDVGMMLLYLLFSFPGATGSTASAPSGSWSDLSAVSYYLHQFLDLAGYGAGLALANPLPLLAFALIMAFQLISVGLLKPSAEGSPNNR